MTARKPKPGEVRKRNWIRRNVAGRSFIDIGGLWGGQAEMVTPAAEGGAARLTMADIQPAGSHWWQVFRDRCAERGVDGVTEIVADICAADAPARLGVHDVVHSSGVMYHVPDIFGYLGNLVAVTGDALVLTSVVIPKRIGTGAAAIDLRDDSALLVPALGPKRRAMLVAHFSDGDPGFTAAGLTDDTPAMQDGRPRYGPWWWLFTAGFMERAVRLTGLEIERSGPGLGAHSHTVIARRPQPA